MGWSSRKPTDFGVYWMRLSSQDSRPFLIGFDPEHPHDFLILSDETFKRNLTDEKYREAEFCGLNEYNGRPQDD